jgi:hypothetical protein
MCCQCGGWWSPGAAAGPLTLGLRKPAVRCELRSRWSSVHGIGRSAHFNPTNLRWIFCVALPPLRGRVGSGRRIRGLYEICGGLGARYGCRCGWLGKNAAPVGLLWRVWYSGHCGVADCVVLPVAIRSSAIHAGLRQNVWPLRELAQRGSASPLASNRRRRRANRL